MVEVSNRTIEDLYPEDPPSIREIAAKLREVVRATLPEATECFHHASLGYGTSASSHDRMIYIAAQRGYVNLGFFFGDSLDGHPLVEGSGKRMRHVKVRTLGEATNTQLPSLVRAAWEDGTRRLAAAKVARKSGRAARSDG